ncbi:MAG: hypothetical protein V4654_11930 [Bdellovibrionota bacterium]
MKTKIIAILLSCLCLHAYGGTEGHGGDPLRLLFEDARPFAADRVMKAMPCAFGANVSADVRNWILSHKQSLAEDINQSEHVWITDKQSTCAFTQTNSRHDITFSFETCRPGVRDISDALKILVHESVHHLGVTDEYFADKVANAIYNLGSNSSCIVPPSKDPFDPASCPGNPLSETELTSMIPLPDSTTKKLGTYRVSSRMRSCYSENWCSKWVLSDGNGFFTHTTNYYGSVVAGPAIMGGFATLKYVGNHPVVYIDSDPSVQLDPTWDSKLGGWVNFTYSTIKGGTGFESNSYGDMNVGITSIKDTPFKGWITNSCFRQTLRSKFKTKDSQYNQIEKEYETVILSQFE